MSSRVFHLTKSPIEALFQLGSAEVFVKREDRIFFSQGTKIRKLSGIYQAILPYLEKGLVRKVVLQGNLHSNAILAAVLFFKWVGVPTKVVTYSRNPKLVTVASQIAKRFSELVLFPTREEWGEFVEVTTNSGDSLQLVTAMSPDSVDITTKSGEFLLPEYLFSPQALSGLESLWGEISESSFDRIILDTGSGLSWISGIRWGKKPVHGICLGLNREKTIDWIQSHLGSLRQKNLKLPWNLLLEPREWMPNSFSFGNKNEYWKNKSIEYWKRYGIFFEPIYAAKSISIIEELVKSKTLKGRILYVYQGGALMGSPTELIPSLKIEEY